MVVTDDDSVEFLIFHAVNCSVLLGTSTIMLLAPLSGFDNIHGELLLDLLRFEFNRLG